MSCKISRIFGRSFLIMRPASSEVLEKPILPRMPSISSTVIFGPVKDAIWSRRDSASRKLPSAETAMSSSASSAIFIDSLSAMVFSLFMIFERGTCFKLKIWVREAMVAGIFSISVVARIIRT